MLKYALYLWGKIMIELIEFVEVNKLELNKPFFVNITCFKNLIGNYDGCYINNKYGKLYPTIKEINTNKDDTLWFLFLVKYIGNGLIQEESTGKTFRIIDTNDTNYINSLCYIEPTGTNDNYVEEYLNIVSKTKEFVEENPLYINCSNYFDKLYEPNELSFKIYSNNSDEERKQIIESLLKEAHQDQENLLSILKREPNENDVIASLYKEEKEMAYTKNKVLNFSNKN